MTTALTGLAFLLYLFAAACYGAVLTLRSPAAPVAGPQPGFPGISRYARPLLLAGILVQFAATGAWCITRQASPFASEYGTLSIVAWSIAVAFAVLDMRRKMPAVGAIALVIACVVLFWGALHANGPVSSSPLLEGQMVSLHVMAIVASIGLFAVAFGCAALYLVQNRLLKEHNVSGLYRRLPSLEMLDTVAYHAVAYGLPLLTLGLTLGIVYVLRRPMITPLAGWLLDPRMLLSEFLWVVYVLYLAARILLGWGGVRLHYILLVGLPIALALYLVPTTVHSFH